nr:hypothetical protein [Tanacetum cinerariifolium]
MFTTAAYLKHDKHHALYDALQESMQVDELQAQFRSVKTSTKKRSHYDQDPPKNRDGEKRMKRQKGAGGFSSKKGPLGIKTILLSYFFNCDLEYLKYGNEEKKVIVPQVQRRQGQSSSLGTIGNATTSRGNNAVGQARVVLDEEQLAFLADPGITDCHDVQPTIIHKAAFQTDDLDAYEFDYDDTLLLKQF